MIDIYQNNSEYEINNNIVEDDLKNNEFYSEKWENVPEVKLELPVDVNNSYTVKNDIKHVICQTCEYVSQIFTEYCEINDELFISDSTCTCFTFSSKIDENQNLKSQIMKLNYLAYVNYDNQIVNYMKIIKDIYCALTNTNFPCPDSGNHWQEIGFQGLHPSSDLRSFALLSLLAIHQFATGALSKSICQKIFLLSHHNIQNFPFCTLCMNIVKFLYLEIKSEKLNSYFIANQTCDIILEFFNLFNAVLYKFYMIWRNEGKTIIDSQSVMDDLLKSLKHPNKLIAFYQKSIEVETVKEYGDIPNISTNFN